MTKREAQAKKEALIAAARRVLDTPEAVEINRQIAALDAEYFPRKGYGVSSRAGQRQAAERRAMHYPNGWR